MNAKVIALLCVLLVLSPSYAAECLVDDSLDQSRPPDPTPTVRTVTVVREHTTSPSITYGSQGLPGKPDSSVSPALQEVRTLLAAISRRDLAEFKRLMPAEEGARRDLLRRSQAIYSTFRAGAWPIAQQIMRWDPEALAQHPPERNRQALTTLAESWTYRGTAKPDPTQPKDSDYLELMRLLISAGTHPDGYAPAHSPLALLAGVPPSTESLQAATLLLQRGATIEQAEKWTRRPLGTASEHKNGPLVALILQSRKPTQAALDEAIAWAVITQDNGAIAPLLKAGAKVDDIGKLKHTFTGFAPPLEAGFRVKNHGERALMRLLLQYKMNPNAEPGKLSAVGILVHDHEMLQALLAAGANPNHQDGEGNTPLILATRIPRTDPAPDTATRTRSVVLLLKAGANPAIANKAGVTPIMQILRDEVAMADLLIAKGGATNPDSRLMESHRRDGKPVGPISWAALQGKDALGAGLLARDRKLAPEDCGAVYYAAITGSTRTLEALLDMKAPVYAAKDQQGKTPLIAAAQSGHAAAVKILLDRRAAKVDETTPSGIAMLGGGHGPSMPGPVGGDTALMLAARGGHIDVVAELVRQGADVNRKNLAGDTALSYARRDRTGRVLELLEKKGAR